MQSRRSVGYIYSSTFTHKQILHNMTHNTHYFQTLYTQELESERTEFDHTFFRRNLELLLQRKQKLQATAVRVLINCVELDFTALLYSVLLPLAEACFSKICTQLLPAVSERQLVDVMDKMQVRSLFLLKIFLLALLVLWSCLFFFSPFSLFFFLIQKYIVYKLTGQYYLLVLFIMRCFEFS